ncbi:outer membrane protein assembly factor BamB family protein [Thalassoroseus pseudoceratinae]|uniref:outer membrane protein assembly factor BamB family protein n=1 Tax=Thalassoroseus pseudoceratinae TaxID=2713176 RepID=UPI00141FFBF2|nr:PQQ-binding-like beta-propeller repeat protein [Thalassoroseus pseudoceratinae]
MVSHRRIDIPALAGMVLALATLSNASAENWPSWRGPSHNGISGETNLPIEFGPDKNVAWKLPLPGQAGATPCIWGKDIFVTSVDDDDFLLMCISTDGTEKWRRVIGNGNQRVRGDEGNYASPSPSTDGKHVWVMFGQGDLACFDFAGNEVWAFNLQDRYGKFQIQFGMASTPVLHKGRLYLQLIHGEGRPNTQEARVVALDASTGKEIWQTGRVTGASQENEHSYASPTLYDDGKETYLVTHGGDYAIAFNLEDGKEIWRLAGLNPRDDPNRRYHPTLRFVASPVANEGMVVVPTAKNGPVVAVKGSARGLVDADSSDHLWTRPQNTPDVPSPLIKDGLVYLCRENGNLLVLDAKTGKEMDENRTTRDRHRASPVWADGKIYLTARGGIITVVKEGAEFEVLSQNDLGEEISASPAISDGTIYLRTFKSLWAIRQK